jgi:hypothetical protein
MASILDTVSRHRKTLSGFALQAALKSAGADSDIVSEMNRKTCPVVMLRRAKSLH